MKLSRKSIKTINLLNKKVDDFFKQMIKQQQQNLEDMQKLYDELTEMQIEIE